MNPTALAITLVITCTLLSMSEAGAPRMQLRCRCRETVKKEIAFHRISKLEIFPPGSQCKNKEVLAMVKVRRNVEKETCLNPQDRWVQDAIEKMTRGSR
ncbi:interleukin-8b.3 [Trichomycterus rosablanca]|uniref:interleukin-8b.3 n=1 Tax=Trichomycterus rosablanca TaxID=2290929 RepID=UPI002F35D03E